MARPKKDPFENLSDDFKGKCDTASDEQLMELLGEVAKVEEFTRRAKADDQDLQEKKTAAEFAGEGYRETEKDCKLKKRYVYDILRARGKAE